MYALGLYVYSFEPPKSPYPFDELAQRGQKLFEAQGCGECHTPPIYTNNKLVPVPGFEPPLDDPATQRLSISNRRVGTDPGLALQTRKGTGYYRIPSLRGLWYRGLYEHNGSVSSLEDWFDPRRLRDDYVPSGWKGPGVKTRAVPGHKFGHDLPQDDKRALIAFLKTL
jgi:cytochrome c peroxidase